MTTRTGRARTLRQTQTNAEAIFWQCVRNRRYRGLKFRRQRPFGTYVLDFFCEELNLVVELDGSHHDETLAQQRDAERTAFLESRGLIVHRVRNDAVTHDIRILFPELDVVVERLQRK